ncbi:MAG: RING finger protein [Chloroflexota bacterium]
MRKVSLLLLLVVVLALGLVLLLQRGHPAPLLMFNLLADGSIGAVMGFGSRWVLRSRHWLIRAVVSASLSIVGLVLLGFLTSARSGIGPLHLQLIRVNWLASVGVGLRVPLLPGNSPTDLLDAAHMVIAMDVSWIALRAWRGGPRLMASQPGRARRSNPIAEAAAPVRMLVAPTTSAATGRPITRSRSRPVIRRKKIGRPFVSKVIAIRPRSAGGRSRSLFRRRLAVQLAAYEEHRCPYCLEDIKRDDIRGSVECPVCHTLHHKDCWDITGTCQVPHLNG